MSITNQFNNVPLFNYSTAPWLAPDPDPSVELNRDLLPQLEVKEEEVEEDAKILFRSRTFKDQSNRKMREKTETDDSEVETLKQIRALKEERTKAEKKRLYEPVVAVHTSEIERDSLPVKIYKKAPPSPINTPLPKTLEGEALLETRFSQRSVSARLDSGTPLFKIVDDNRPSLYDCLRKEGWKKGEKPLIVVEMPDGLTSFDNRRLAVAKTIIKDVSHSLAVPVEAHYYHERAPRSLLTRAQNVVSKFEDPSNSIPLDSYGEAIACRVAGSAKLSQVNLTNDNRWGFARLPDVALGIGGRNPHAIRVDPDTKVASLVKKRHI